jgi:hypothetical protein
MINGLLNDIIDLNTMTIKAEKARNLFCKRLKKGVIHL